MKHFRGWIFTMLILTGLLLSACGQKPADTVKEEGPAKVEHLTGAEPTRITLTEDAAKRLDIQTVPVGNAEVSGAQRMVVPYSAILYDTHGATWIYASSASLVYVRYPITVDRIEGNQAFLTAGPPSDSAVVSIGAAELFGSESEFEEE